MPSQAEGFLHDWRQSKSTLVQGYNCGNFRFPKNKLSICKGFIGNVMV